MENKVKIEIPIMADCFSQGKSPEYLYWVGSAGAFDDRYKQVSRAFVKILSFLDIKINFASLLSLKKMSWGLLF